MSELAQVAESEEQIARAIYEEAPRDPQDDVTAWDGLNPLVRNVYRHYARTALRLLRKVSAPARSPEGWPSEEQIARIRRWAEKARTSPPALLCNQYGDRAELYDSDVLVLLDALPTARDEWIDDADPQKAFAQMSDDSSTSPPGWEEAREACATVADLIAEENNTGSGFDSNVARGTAWKIARTIRSLPAPSPSSATEPDGEPDRYEDWDRAIDAWEGKSAGASSTPDAAQREARTGHPAPDWARDQCPYCGMWLRRPLAGHNCPELKSNRPDAPTLEQIRGHLGACLVQRAPSDDAVIFEHIQAAYDLSAPSPSGKE